VLDFVINATGEAFYLAFDTVETIIHFREVRVDRGELSNAGIGKRLDQAIDVREAFFHASGHLSKAFIDLNKASIDLRKALIDKNEALFGPSEALVHLLFETIEAFVEIGLLHTREVYHMRVGGSEEKRGRGQPAHRPLIRLAPFF
jgi:hypothetical protein